MKARRLSTVLATSVLLVSAAGTTSAQSPGAASPAAAGSAQARSVTFIPGVKGDSFFATTVCGAEAAARDLGITLDVQLPSDFSAQAELPILQAATQQSVDGIIIFPDDPVGLTAALHEAQDAGIKVHTFSADVTDPTARSANVHLDLSVGGELAGEKLAEAIGGTGKVFVMNVIKGISSTDARQTGFERAMANHPDIQYLGGQYGDNDPTKSAQVTGAVIQANPDLAGIYATNIFSGLGAINAVRQAGLTDQIKVILHDTAAPEVEALRNGDVIGLIGTNAYRMGYEAVSAMAKDLDGQEPTYDIPQELYITKDTIDDPTVQQENVYKDAC
jgi:ribose transport system substrate-binding protein